MVWAKEEKFPLAAAKPSAPISGFWRYVFGVDIMGEMVQIKVEGFDGPLDLLLELIDREQLNITALSIAEVADQYWREIESAQEFEPDTLAEFINVGSKLLYIKSCALIPSAEPPSSDLREQIEEAAGELTRMLEEHKRFKDAVDLFRQLEEEGRRTYARVTPVQGMLLPPGLEGVTLDTLLSVVKDALARRPEEPEQAVLHIEPVTVTEKIEEISGALDRKRGRLGLRPLLEACETRTEIVVLFLAVLELIKSGRLWAEQPEPFGEIVLVEGAVEPA